MTSLESLNDYADQLNTTSLEYLNDYADQFNMTLLESLNDYADQLNSTSIPDFCDSVSPLLNVTEPATFGGSNSRRRRLSARKAFYELWMKWLVLCSMFAARLVPNYTDVVRVSGGLLQGVTAPDGSHVAYYGIPYATVTDRFQEAIPDPQWEGILKADNENVRCTQRSKSFVVGTEDCLILNVYQPLPAREELRPVMIFIHGGGFREGSSTPYMYGPKFLIEHDVILVTINYRLEILGFLCLGIEEAPGNMGLKDQVEALKWVQRNIKAFGGDPDNVTIFGESAGASSVSYHLLSPMSKGLFHKAIIESGSALSYWAFQFDPIEIAHKFASQLGEDTASLQKLVSVLKSKSDTELLRTRVPRDKGDIVQSENIFVPCVEKDIPGVNRFLTDYPYKLISEGKYNRVPLIIGFNNREGFYFAGNENVTTISNMKFLNSLPRDLEFPTDDEKMTVAINMKKLYMPEDEVTQNKLVNLADFEGDCGITYPTAITINKFLETGDMPVYAYKFTHDGWWNIPKLISGFGMYPGATHADELFYIFSNNLPGIYLSEDKEIVNMMTTMWTNFAKYSNPTPGDSADTWSPATINDTQVFVIDNDVRYDPLWNSERLKYWKTVYSTYRRKM